MCRLAVALAAAVVALAACGGGDNNAAAASSRLEVSAAFYPLQWMAEQVGGDLVTVQSVTPPGAEPHDLELTPRDVADLDGADAVVYLDGFQPAVDEAVSALDGDRVFDAAKASDATDATGAVDPHFWLDPTELAQVGDAFGEFLARRDPEHAAAFSKRAASLRGALGALDEELRTGLASCSNKQLVTTHNAFGYLARRYGFEQVGITGLTPEEEPSPADLAAVTDFVRDHDVRTIYFETLVSPDIADTVARETGARTDVLDPIEGLTDASEGRDYLEIMRSNLVNLREGQPCR